MALLWYQMTISNHWQFNCLLNSLIRITTKETSKFLIIEHLWEKSTGHWWIPLTKGQYWGKCFHVVTSSCQYQPIIYHNGASTVTESSQCFQCGFNSINHTSGILCDKCTGSRWFWLYANPSPTFTLFSLCFSVTIVIKPQLMYVLIHKPCS